MKRAIYAVLLCYFFELLLSEVTVLNKVQYIYDKSPKVKIRGAGFEAADHDTIVDIGVSGEPPLVVDKDFTVYKSDDDSDNIILKLLGNRRWVNIGARQPPIALVLSGVYFRSNPKKNLLAEAVIVAQVLNTPTVQENKGILYITASNELRINGTGFMGSKEVDFYFKPPLVKEVAYEDVTEYPLRSDQITLRLRHGYSWREDGPGPLYVIGVDLQGGAVKVNGEAGVLVAEVQADLDLHGVTVETTSEEQLLYDDEANLLITGTGFNPIGNTLRWSNGLTGNGVNYTMVRSTETSISLRLNPGSHWRANFVNLPGVLTLLAVNAGEGFVAVGPTNAKKGRDIATIFERPSVYSCMNKIYRTHSHEFHFNGTGFPLLSSGYKPLFRFYPALKDSDYTARVVSQQEVEVTLSDGAAWRSEPGPLQITHVNTRGDEAGWVALPGSGVHVAEVLEDVDSATTGGVEIYPQAVKVYQSALQEVVPVVGSGFSEGMSFTLDPPLTVGVDYSVEFVNSHSVKLHLVKGKKWSSEPSLLIVKSVTIGKSTYPLAGKEGIRVAVILEDPSIDESNDNVHESQSKLLIITGTGFTDIESVKIQLRPTEANAFKVLSVVDDMIRLQLNPKQDWLPSYVSLKNEDDKKIELKIYSIDTGAGEIVLTKPVTVGLVVKDLEGVVCDDTCEFAFDGECDDGSEPVDEYYYQNYFPYQDDDLGGYYTDDDEEEEWPKAPTGKKGKPGKRRQLAGRQASSIAATHGDHQQLSPAFTYNYDDYYYGYDGNESYGFYYGYERRRLAEGKEEDDYQWDNYGSDDYYAENDEKTVSPCVKGTDCTDCGGVDAVKDFSQPLDDETAETCVNTCSFARDGVCDDPRGTMYCSIGTDCQDCGPVGFDNFTLVDDDEFWDDDDDYWNFNDGEFLDQAKGLEANRHKVKSAAAEDDEEAGAIFLIILEGMVYAVGAIFFAAAAFLTYQWYTGEAVPFASAFNAELSAKEFEMKPTKKMAITPDEFRT